MPQEDSGAFGFFDPADVLCGVHLMPAFVHGRTEHLLGPSIVRQPAEKNEDWVYHYTGM
jgi:hypothetical protein